MSKPTTARVRARHSGLPSGVYGGSDVSGFPQRRGVRPVPKDHPLWVVHDNEPAQWWSDAPRAGAYYLTVSGQFVQLEGWELRQLADDRPVAA